MADNETLSLYLAFTVTAYLVGSVNLSIMTSRVLKIKNMTTTGSGNPGATNLLRVAGPKIAVPVLIAELLKAFLVFRAIEYFGDTAMTPPFVLPFLLGNLFPLFHRFKGGKGVAATVGAYLALDPFIMLLGGGLFIATFTVTRRVSAGSLAMGCSYPFLSLWLHRGDELFTTSIAVALILLFTHRANIKRLVCGVEPKLGLK